jgi:hypothetical protein
MRGRERTERARLSPLPRRPEERIMTVDERARHQLFVKLEEVLGPDEATTLMETLPPTGYEDLATKQDLIVLRNEILAELRHDISNQTRTIVFALVAVVVSISSVALFR